MSHSEMEYNIIEEVRVVETGNLFLYSNFATKLLVFIGKCLTSQSVSIPSRN